jgi:hypothetical protein
MTDRVAWVDETCRALQLRCVSPWLPWALRERHEACHEPACGASCAASDDLVGRSAAGGTPGVYVLAWGERVDAREVIWVGQASRIETRLRELEGSVKWRQQAGYGVLRDLLERRGDHRVMSRVWIKIIRVDEEPLVPSSLLTGQRLDALGAKRGQVQTVLLAEHYRRFGAPVAADRSTDGLRLGDLVRAAPSQPAPRPQPGPHWAAA